MQFNPYSTFPTAIKRFPYRTATVTSRMFSISYDSQDYIDNWQAQLASMVRERTDNHECYQIETQDGKTFYVQFSDWTAYFGLSIVEKSW